MEYLILILHTLVNIIIDAMLSKLLDQAINTSITNNMQHTRVAVSPHNWIDVANNLCCHLCWYVNGVSREGVVQLILKYLSLASFQS